MSDYPLPPCKQGKRPPADKIGSCAQRTSSHRPSVSLLESKVPHGQLRPAVLRHTVAFLPAPHPSAWSDTRRRDSGRDWSSVQGLFCQAPLRASIDQRSVRARLIAHSSLRKATKR